MLRLINITYFNLSPLVDRRFNSSSKGVSNLCGMRFSNGYSGRRVSSATSRKRTSQNQEGPHSLFENYDPNFKMKCSNGIKRDTSSSFRISGINSVRSSGFKDSTVLRPKSALQPTGPSIPSLCYGITLQDLNRDGYLLDARVEHQSYGNGSWSSRNQSEWKPLHNTSGDPARNSSVENDENNKNRKNVWQWRGRTIAFGGKTSSLGINQRQSKSIQSHTCSKNGNISQMVTPRGRWGGSVGEKIKDNSNQHAAKDKNDDGKKNETNASKDNGEGEGTIKFYMNKPDNGDHSIPTFETTEKRVNHPTATSSESKHGKKTSEFSQDITAGVINQMPRKKQGEETMIFVMSPRASTATAASTNSTIEQPQKNQDKVKIPAPPSPSSKVFIAMPSPPPIVKSTSPKRVQSSTLSALGGGGLKKQKKKKRTKVSFSVDSPEVNIFEPVKPEDRKELWHSHEDSIRNRLELKLERAEHKKNEILKENKAREADIQNEEDAKDAKMKSKALRKKRKAEAAEKKRLEVQRIKLAKEKELVRRKMEQAEKREKRKIQKQVSKAEAAIETNMKKKFGLHVEEVQSKEDTEMHDRIQNLENELKALKCAAVKRAQEKNAHLHVNPGRRSGKPAAGSHNWRRGAPVPVMKFHERVQLPFDIRNTLTLQDRKEMKKHTYSFD